MANSANEIKSAKRFSIMQGRIRMSKTLLLDLTCVMWLCNMPLRSVIAKVLGIVRAGAYSVPVTAILIFLPLVMYIILEKKLPWRYFHWIFLGCAIFFGTTILIRPEYLHWYTRKDYSVMHVVFSPDNGAIWAFLMIEISGTGERIWKNFKAYAAVLFIYNLYLSYQASIRGYWLAYNGSGEMGAKAYSLDFGYDMIFVFLVVLICYFREKKVRYIFMGIPPLIFVLLQGSRGALLCAVVFLVSYFLGVSNRQRGIKKFFSFFIIILSGAIVYIFGGEIMQFVAKILIEVLGFSSRTLTQIVNGDLINDSGRGEIYQIAKRAIADNPILGQGAYGDRPWIGPNHYWGYSHSIIYEMMINFGIIVGSAILIGIIYKSIKMIFKNPDKLLASLYLLIFSISIRLVVSDTFWGNEFFWMALAMLFVFNKYYKKKEV